MFRISIDSLESIDFTKLIKSDGKKILRVTKSHIEIMDFLEAERYLVKIFQQSRQVKDIPVIKCLDKTCYSVILLKRTSDLSSAYDLVYSIYQYFEHINFEFFIILVKKKITITIIIKSQRNIILRFLKTILRSKVSDNIAFLALSKKRLLNYLLKLIKIDNTFSIRIQNEEITRLLKNLAFLTNSVKASKESMDNNLTNIANVQTPTVHLNNNTIRESNYLCNTCNINNHKKIISEYKASFIKQHKKFKIIEEPHEEQVSNDFFRRVEKLKNKLEIENEKIIFLNPNEGSLLIIDEKSFKKWYPTGVLILH